MKKLIDRLFRRKKKITPMPVYTHLFDEYQDFAVSTADPCAEEPLYLAVGLCEEAGEVAGKVKKVMRDHHGFFTHQQNNAVAMELGDVLWYLANQAHRMGFTLSEVAELNMRKVKRRIDHNTLHGEGDQR